MAEERTEEYEIKDEIELNKQLYHLRKLREEAESYEEQYKTEKADLDARREACMNENEIQQNNVMLLIQAYMDKRWEQNPKYKARLLNGTVGTRKQTNWKKNDDELIKRYQGTDFVEEKLKWGNLKRSLKAVDGKAIDKETGEIVPGITTEQSEKLNITWRK